MTWLLGASVGVCFAAGVLLLVLGLQRRPARDRPTVGPAERWATLTRRPSGPAGRRRDLWLAGSAVLTLVVFAVTGLPVMLLVVPLATIVVPWLLGNPNEAAIARTAAVDQWVRSLRSLLLSGSDNTLEATLQASLSSAPRAIHTEVRMLVARINSRWPTDKALAAFADELADPTADVVAAALILAARRRGAGLTVVLDGLAVAVADEVRARRRIESERASTRAAARYLVIIFVAMALGLAVLNPGYLAPYDTELGQLILAGTVLGFIASLWLLRRITLVRDHPRVHPVVREVRSDG
ncbi:type II secretion system F family protein [Propionibacteriaceae bacterium Y2011]